MASHDWFQRFKMVDFYVENKKHPGQVNKFEIADLKASLDEDPCQTQQDLADTLGVTQQTISHCLKALGMIQKQGHWVPYELTPRNIEPCLLTSEQLLQRQNRKGFLDQIVTGHEKWIYYDHSKGRKSWGHPGHAAQSVAKSNIHGFKIMLCIW